MDRKIVRSRAPLRLGLAGGGTDLSPYSDDFGGLVINCTLSLFARCTIDSTQKDSIVFEATDLDAREEYAIGNDDKPLPIDNKLRLHSGVYNRIIKDYMGGKKIPMRISSHCDVPAGSGLGSSSTMVVALLKAMGELLDIPFSPRDLAELAVDIERNELDLQGGKQDQFAAAFGGFNQMAFHEKNRVTVDALNIKNWVKSELEDSLLLFFTGASRESANIIKDQVANIKNEVNLDALHTLKRLALDVRDHLYRADVDNIANILHESWIAKKQASARISNSSLDSLYEIALNNGAKGGKISGAGGGGFMFLIADPKQRHSLARILEAESEGQCYLTVFTTKGAEAWVI